MKMFFLTLMASTSFAILPPLAQSTREMKAILSDPHMQEWLGSGEIIKEISRNEQGYLVVTTHYAMQVDLHYTHDGKRIGPAQFNLEFNHPVRTSSASELSN